MLGCRVDVVSAKGLLDRDEERTGRVGLLVGPPAGAACTPEMIDLGLRDPDDEWIVASAVAGKADALVTGDRDTLETTVRLPIRAYNPRQFWEQGHKDRSG